jgi:hypothetical protein
MIPCSFMPSPAMRGAARDVGPLPRERARRRTRSNGQTDGPLHASQSIQSLVALRILIVSFSVMSSDRVSLISNYSLRLNPNLHRIF